jgi:hypothetical protein
MIPEEHLAFMLWDAIDKNYDDYLEPDIDGLVYLAGRFNLRKIAASFVRRLDSARASPSGDLLPGADERLWPPE